jgi:hypothetical protein
MRAFKGFSIVVAILAATVVALVPAEAGAEVWQTVYQTDFSSDPGWTTDDPANLRWDSATGTFHGTQVNVQGTYAYTDVAGFDPTKSWKLEFDTKINSSGWSAGRDVGLYDSRINAMQGSRADTLQGIADQGNATSIYYSGGEGYTYSPAWSAGVWYHYTLEYDAATSQLTQDVFDRSSGTLLWSLGGTVSSFSTDMTYLGVSRLHMRNDYSGVDPNATVDYNLDNLVLSQGTSEPSSVPEPSALVAWIGLGVMGLAIGWCQRKRPAA